MRYLPLLAMVFLASIVNAYDFEMNITAYDFNTNNSLADVTVYLNTSQNMTDVNGFCSVYGNGTFLLNASRTGYHFYSQERVIAGNGSTEIRLYPSTTDGFFRDRLSDLTFGFNNLTVCLYYTSNDRLHGCFDMQDNITTNENINYTLRILSRKTDMILNPANAGSMFLSWSFPAIIVILVIAMLYYLVVKKK